MTFTNMNVLGDILASIQPGEGFSIRGNIETEADFDSNVIYDDPSKKPSWESALAGRDAEQWRAVRGDRNGRLAASDWTVLSDVPILPEKENEWVDYRQELRDITDQPDPFNITWPTPPD